MPTGLESAVLSRRFCVGVLFENLSFFFKRKFRFIRLSYSVSVTSILKRWLSLLAKKIT